jgi:hypothetical protein
MIAINKSKIISTVIQSLQWSGIDAEFEASKDDNCGIDGILTLMKGDIELSAVIKSTFQKHQILRLIEKKENFGNQFLLVCENISQPTKELLRQHEINYADSHGNLRIFLPNQRTFYWFDGAKKQKADSSSKEQKLTTSMAIMLLYYLDHKAQLNQTVRQLASNTNLSNDTIQKTKDWLKSKGFIIAQNKKEYIWNDWKAAYERWLSAYEELLKPKSFLRSFVFVEKNRRPAALANLGIGLYWTGEAALFHLESSLVNAVLWELYSKKSALEVAKQLHLLPNNNGNVKVYRQFWEWDSPPSPLVIYADLLLNSDARIQELSKKYEHENIQPYY